MFLILLVVIKCNQTSHTKLTTSRHLSCCIVLFKVASRSADTVVTVMYMRKMSKKHVFQHFGHCCKWYFKLVLTHSKRPKDGQLRHLNLHKVRREICVLYLCQFCALWVCNTEFEALFEEKTKMLKFVFLQKFQHAHDIHDNTCASWSTLTEKNANWTASRYYTCRVRNLMALDCS